MKRYSVQISHGGFSVNEPLPAGTSLHVEFCLSEGAPLVTGVTMRPEAEASQARARTARGTATHAQVIAVAPAWRREDVEDARSASEGDEEDRGERVHVVFRPPHPDAYEPGRASQAKAGEVAIEAVPRVDDEEIGFDEQPTRDFDRHELEASVAASRKGIEPPARGHNLHITPRAPSRPAEATDEEASSREGSLEARRDDDEAAGSNSTDRAHAAEAAATAAATEGLRSPVQVVYEYEDDQEIREVRQELARRRELKAMGLPDIRECALREGRASSSLRAETARLPLRAPPEPEAEPVVAAVPRRRSHALTFALCLIFALVATLIVLFSLGVIPPHAGERQHDPSTSVDDAPPPVEASKPDIEPSSAHAPEASGGLDPAALPPAS
jgi:hypothetical protein